MHDERALTAALALCGTLDDGGGSVNRSVMSGFAPIWMVLWLAGLATTIEAVPARLAEAQGVDQLQRARDLMAEVQRRGQEGRYQEAIPKAREALAIREALLAPTHPLVIQSVGFLAFLLRENGDYAEARSLYERALTVRE